MARALQVFSQDTCVAPRAHGAGRSPGDHIDKHGTPFDRRSAVAIWRYCVGRARGENGPHVLCIFLNTIDARRSFVGNERQPLARR